ncbi:MULTISPECIES: DUF6380 family protein [unclassified Streptomyces]
MGTSTTGRHAGPRRRATFGCPTASLTATAGRGARAHRGGRTGEGAR